MKTESIQDNILTQLYYYNEEGNEIGSFSIGEEIVGDFIVETNKGITYLFNNFSVVADYTDFKEVDDTTSLIVRNFNQGPDTSGYITSKDIVYSLINVGTRDGQYNTMLRFTSEHEIYSIIIPDYITSIYYDEEKDAFFCMLFSEASGELEISYKKIMYNEEERKYLLNNAIYTIHGTVDDRAVYRNGMDNDIVYNNILYHINASEPDKYVHLHSDKKYLEENKIRIDDAVLRLFKIDLDENKLLGINIGSTPYKKSIARNHPYLYGSNDLPICSKNGLLYCFTSDMKVHIFNPQDESIMAFNLKFDFTEIAANNILNIEDKFKEFINANISIENDGKIYIANIYRDRKLRIHVFNEEKEEFELFFESKGEAPKMGRENMGIQSFEIINLK